MQLIYGFRGSRDERLQRHRDECDQEFELRTPHRWHGSDEPLALLYEHGGRAYVECVVGILEACADRGYHLPRVEAVRALREAAQALASERSEVELDDVLVRYAARAAAASHAAPPL
jgi:hypothetical protein